MEEIRFWKDREKGLVDPTLFSMTADDLAGKLKADHDGEKKKPNKPTQIRKFYDEVVRLNMEANARKEDWESILPIVHMLVAKAAYAQGRELVSGKFVDFIKSSVNQIQSPRDLALFASIFEALMGFYKLHVPKD